AYNVVTFVHPHSPPVILGIAFQFDATWSVLPAAVAPAVNFTRLENESATLTQADDLFHALGVCLEIHKSALFSHRFTGIAQIPRREFCSGGHVHRFF